MAKLSGYKVLTTCSPRNFDYVKSLGADAVFDYRDADCGNKINEATNDSLRLVWDTISLPESAKICADAFSSHSTDARYGTILPVELPGRSDVKTMHTLMYTIFNEFFHKFGADFLPSSEDFEFAKKFFGIAENLLAEGKLHAHSVKIGSDGLEGALQGMLDLKNDKVSGQKLVYRVSETPADSNAEIEL